MQQFVKTSIRMEQWHRDTIYNYNISHTLVVSLWYFGLLDPFSHNGSLLLPTTAILVYIIVKTYFRIAIRQERVLV